MQSLFVIEGEDIANAVFDILEISAKPAEENELRRILKEEATDIGLDLSDAEIEDILRRSK